MKENKPKETQHTDFLSDCCNEAYYSRCADEGTCHAVCVKCEKPCNLIKSGAFDKPNKVEEKIVVPICNDCKKPHFGRSKSIDRCWCDTSGNYTMGEITKENL